MKRGLRWLACCAALLLTSCGTRIPAGSALAAVPLRFGLATAPITLEPRYATVAASSPIDRLLYRGLVTFDAAARPVPDLAHWERLSPTVYRFHLGARGREFQDGEHLTSADVKATYESILNPATGSPLRDTLKRVAGIRSIDTPDPDTVDFVLDRPNALFPSYLTVGILPKRLLDSGHRFAQDPVGSGPFAFVAWPDAERLLLRRRRDGQAFEFLVVRDPTVRVLKLLRGEIDMLQNDLPPELITYLERRKDVRVEHARGTNLTYLGFNLRDPITGQLRVRRAIAHAINRAAIIRYVLGGAARPAESLLPPSHWAGNPDLHGYAYDPARARALLRAAGFGPGHPARITYKTSSDPFRVRLATVIQYQLGQVGIHVHLQSYDWGTFYGDIKSGRFQMYSLS
ncbi:MAG: ABC transporter substrate-binding protein, partial [Gammaproteobacteria bacterium]